MVELLMVIIIIAVLVALLLPAIQSAIRTARKAAVTSEIAQLAQALANFKSKYGDYPPSRFLAVESGNYASFLGSNGHLNGSSLDPTSPGFNDINLGQLAQRSVAALRKFWPRVSTTSAPAGQFYDFNGDGVLAQTPYVVHGHECLVLFLGGIPAPSQGGFGIGGFDKNPTNPFTTVATNANRQPALFEFNPGRLFLDPNSSSGIPGYYDSLGNTAPAVGGSSLNFYAYFSAYGNGAYDPNDVNFNNEFDSTGSGPIALAFSTAFPIVASSAAPGVMNYCGSYSPNPYTSTTTIAQPTSTNPVSPTIVNWQNPQSFQIISSGLDGLYGVGGQYNSNAQGPGVELLPIDNITTVPSTDVGPYIGTSDPNVRQREKDNLTNFKTGSLE